MCPSHDERVRRNYEPVRSAYSECLAIVEAAELWYEQHPERPYISITDVIDYIYDRISAAAVE